MSPRGYVKVPKRTADIRQELEATRTYFGPSSYVRMQLCLLILVAEQLEELTRLLRPKQVRQPTAWQRFCGQELRKGKTMAEVSAEWKRRNPPDESK